MVSFLYNSHPDDIMNINLLQNVYFLAFVYSYQPLFITNVLRFIYQNF